MTSSNSPSEWVAVRRTDDLGALKQRISAAHTDFLESTTEPDRIRKPVLDSWQRSRTANVDPNSIAPEATLSDFDQYRAAHPMALVRPVINRLLVEDAVDTGLLVAISDAAGRLLWVDGDTAAQDRARTMNFAPGADWSESAVGTNAPGTALATDHGIQIFGAEHFSRAVHEWSCTAAPIHDPTTGRTLGAVDLTGGPQVAVKEVFALIRATVAAAESELRWQLKDRPEYVVGDTPRLTVLGSGRPVLRRGAEQITISRRHAEILLLLLEHPEGLTGDHLAVLLDEVDLDPVTVRAEVSRLRRVVGNDAVTSQPYRLTGTLACDAAEVRAALMRGDIAGALRLYTGPVLPSSDAPGVYRLREELRARIRSALLRTRDPHLLLEWVNCPDGRDDLESLRVAIRIIDRASPVFSQLAARIQVLDRELG